MPDIRVESAPPDKPKWILPPWREFKEDYVPYGLLSLTILLLIAILVYSRLRRVIDRRLATAEAWARVRAHCRSQGLTPEEEAVLVTALEHIRITTPDSAVVSEGYYRTFVEPEISRRRNASYAKRIEEKLFGRAFAPRAEEEGAAATRTLHAGQRLRLRFRGFPGGFDAVLISIFDDGFAAAFPAASPRDLHLQAGDRVAGVFETDNALYAFTSTLIDATPGAVYTCRIAHTVSVMQVHRRASIRVTVEQALQVTRLPDGEAGKDGLAETPERTALNTRDGILCDISLGGSAIRTGGGHLFRVGDLVHFHLPLEDGDAPPLPCLGRVASLTATAAGSKEQMLHIEFLGLEEQARQRLALLVTRLLAADGEEADPRQS